MPVISRHWILQVAHSEPTQVTGISRITDVLDSIVPGNQEKGKVKRFGFVSHLPCEL